ncbi:MAG: type I restriction endonuclease subunit R [Victivallales bacterium]
MNDEFIIVESPAIEQMKNLGYKHIQGDALSPDIANPERGSWRDVVLVNRLKQSLKKINPWLSDDNLNKAVHDLTFINQASLIESNRWLYENLVNEMSYEQDMGKGRKGQTVKIIDFDNIENNEFLVVSQFKIHGLKQNIIPDIIIFINGLPIAVIECKSPFITNPLEEGINQLHRYQNKRVPEEHEGADRLFWYNQILVSSHFDKAVMGTIGADYEHYMAWKDAYPFKAGEDNAKLGITHGKPNLSQQEMIIGGVFSKRNLLDIIRNFIIFEPVDGKIIKKICRYQQYRAVHKAIKRMKTEKDRYGKGGVIWHTQGSGKSLTMVFFAVQMRRDPELKDYKIVFITDRTQLDGQLKGTFEHCQDETIHHAKSVRHFKELLKRDSSDLVLGMLQKLQGDEELERMELLNDSDKIILLIDEAHRSQYSTLGVNLNVALPNAPKIAFTGTPLIKSQKTRNEFGSYIDTYTIDQSVKDGATLQIMYEGRESNTKVTGDSLDKLFDFYFKDKTEAEKAEIKKRYGQEAAVLEAPKRIEMIAVDILEHYRTHIKPNGFKAQIVTSSREAAVRYKKALDRLGAPESAVIISGDHNDKPHIVEHTDPKKQKLQIERFKKPMADDQLSFLIVKDMLLTGFDAPVEQVMYLDRKLLDHSLLQAIARVNRTATGKTRGYIVDYYGLADYLKEALEVFSSADVKGALVPINEELPRLEMFHSKAKSYFKGLDLKDKESCVEALKDEKVRADFMIDFKKFMKSMDIVMPRAEASQYIGDLKLMGRLCIAARNRYRDEQLNITGCGEKVRSLIDEHIYSTGVDPKIPPIALISEKFEPYVASLKTPKAQASEIEHAIKHHITVNIETDPEYFKKLSERLNHILQKYHENWDLLLLNLKEVKGSIETKRQSEAEELNLSKQEYAFYNILKAEMGIESPDEDKKAEMIEATSKIFDIIREKTAIVEFFRKDDEVKDLIREIKRNLLHLVEDNTVRKKIIERFIELAKVNFGNTKN